jgi:choline dehydrogenase-like flavoprotein
MTGIGPAKHLKEMGIPVIADLPVGYNLQEHVASGVHFSLNETIALELFEDAAPWRFYDYFIARNNTLTSNILEGISFVKTKFANQNDDWPDIQFHVLPGI